MTRKKTSHLACLLLAWDMSHYYPGHGLPPYLHSRNYETSSTDNDGASEIFASSSSDGTLNVIRVTLSFSFFRKS